MKFNRLFIKNIRSYAEQEIIFPDGSLLLSGDIGAGKTTILLAIEYALFGLQPGQRGTSLLRNGTDLGEVSLEFEIDGNEILIERKLRRSSKSIGSEYTAITINGEKKECSSTELKTQVLTLLGYPFEFVKKNNLLYRYTVYTPQEQMKQIILEDPEVRLNILRHIFGIEKYKRVKENIIILTDYLKGSLKVLQGEIGTLESDRNTLLSSEAFSKSLSEKAEEKEEELEKKVELRKKIESELTELEGRIKEKNTFEKEVEKTLILMSTKKESLSSIEKELAETSASIKEIGASFREEDLAEAEKNVVQHKNRLDSLGVRYFEVGSKTHSTEKSIESASAKNQRIFKMDLCPTCLQNVPDSHKYNIMNAGEREIVDLKSALDLFKKEMLEISAQMNREKSEVSKYEDKKRELEILKSRFYFMEKSKNKLSELAKTKDFLEKDISLLSRHIDSLKEDILKFSKYNNLLRLKQEDVRFALKDEKMTEISLAELKKESEITLREMMDLRLKIAQKEAAKNKMNNILELSDWLSSHFLGLVDLIERNVMMRLRVEFSKLFSKWFYMLAGDSFEAHIDENFTPLILQGGAEMDYAFLSGGERTAVALAYRLALNQTIKTILTSIKTGDIIILDEPTDGFSDAQLEKIRDIFEELTLNQLIVVSHEQKIESFVDNVIRLRKENQRSVLDISESSLFSKLDSSFP